MFPLLTIYHNTARSQAYSMLMRRTLKSGLVVAACDLVYGSLSVVRFVLPLTFVNSLCKILIAVCGQRGCCNIQRCLAMVAEGRFMYVHSWKGVCFIFSWINLKGISVIIGMSTAMAEAAYGVMSNTLKLLRKTLAVRGRHTFHL